MSGSDVRRCAVLGRPIAHSLSPVLHRAAYSALGLPWTYDAVEVGEDELAGFVTTLASDWRGLSLTMPLKRAVLPLLDQVDAHVERSGVANTVVLEGDRRWGHNTDIPGAVAAMRERGVDGIETATVLGGGATAASLVLALRDLGVGRVVVAARNPDKARDSMPPDIADSLEYAELADAPAFDLVASTIPSDAVSGGLLDRLAEAAYVFDVIYDPWPTALAAAATGSVI
ncbi:MAG: shikimate dehydrogenase, partial [Myxococcales bacterium]